jgi:hypothetical protein
MEQVGSKPNPHHAAFLRSETAIGSHRLMEDAGVKM